jgi:lipopolysaccharide biosynthesis protein
MEPSSAGVRHFNELVTDAARAAVGHLRRLRKLVSKTWPGADPCAGSKREAVYVHYDRYGVVHDYVIHQLRELIDAGFRVTFVTNSRNFKESNATEVAPYCRQILLRRNVGHDFGAYKDGIAAVGDLSRITCLLLMNDSVYGPFRPLKDLLAAVDPQHTDVWGITDSWEHNYHIQTYFILFFERALRLPEFAWFWQRLPYVNDRLWVIRHGELKLTRILTERKMRAAVLAPYWDAAEIVRRKFGTRIPDDLAVEHKQFLESLRNRLAMGRPMNPMHYFWDTLIADFGCPFIKRDLIHMNPVHIPFHWRWAEVIAQDSRYDLGLIRRHLQGYSTRETS